MPPHRKVQWPGQHDQQLPHWSVMKLHKRKPASVDRAKGPYIPFLVQLVGLKNGTEALEGTTVLLHNLSKLTIELYLYFLRFQIFIYLLTYLRKFPTRNLIPLSSMTVLLHKGKDKAQLFLRDRGPLGT